MSKEGACVTPGVSKTGTISNALTRETVKRSRVISAFLHPNISDHLTSTPPTHLPLENYSLIPGVGPGKLLWEHL